MSLLKEIMAFIALKTKDLEGDLESESELLAEIAGEIEERQAEIDEARSDIEEEEIEDDD